MIYYHCSTCGLDLAEADTYEGIEGEECRVLCGTCESVVEERDTDALTERLATAEERVRALGGDLAFWHEEAHAARAWLGRLVERGCVPDEWQRYVAQFADATPTPRRTAEREAAERATDERAAEAWADDVALFILHKVTEATSLTLAEIAPNLTAPNGWLSFARLWRADYIIVTGDLVQPTERGVAAMRELLICVADVELDATNSEGEAADTQGETT